MSVQYLLSMEDKEGKIWDLLAHAIGLLPRGNIYPVTEHRISEAPPQSASVKPVRILGSLLGSPLA